MANNHPEAVFVFYACDMFQEGFRVIVALLRAKTIPSTLATLPCLLNDGHDPTRV